MTNAQESQHRTVLGPVRSETLALGSTATRDRFFVNYQGEKVRGAAEDDIIIVEMKADAQGSVDSGSTILIPVTVKNTSTGEEIETYLTGADLGLSSTDVVIGTTWTAIGHYDVPAQTAVKIGHKSALNSYAYVSLSYTA
jgi:hypothetical protein